MLKYIGYSYVCIAPVVRQIITNPLDPYIVNVNIVYCMGCIDDVLLPIVMMASAGKHDFIVLY